MANLENKVIIDCDKRVVLNGYNYLNNINAVVNDYIYNDNLINGNIKIIIDYNHENELNTLEELIPFEVSLLNENLKDCDVEGVEVINFNYYEIVNQGLQCSFQIKISLKEKEESQFKIEDTIEKNISYNDYLNDDTVIENEITDKYENLLDELFNEEELESGTVDDQTNDTIKLIDIKENLDDDYLIKEDKNLNINTSINERFAKDECLSFRNIPERLSTYRIYYPKSENEIDKVCVTENVSLTNVYSNGLNKDFSQKKRIVIEK